MRIVAVLVLGLLALAPLGVGAQYRDPGTGAVIGFSGAAHVVGNQYLVVFDSKAHEPEGRVGTLTMNPAGAPSLHVFPDIDWKDDRSKASDLESVCAIPGRAGELLLAESGSWEGRPGRLFRVRVSGDKLTVVSHTDLPIFANNARGITGDQTEGLACAERDEDTIWVILGERGGSSVYPEGRLRWVAYDLETNSLGWTDEGRAGVGVSAPGTWLRSSHRAIAALHIDESGFLWAAATEDGGDWGPFRSVVYKVATVTSSGPNPLRVLPTLQLVWEVAGSKLEALASPPVAWRYAWLMALSENEALGGTVHGLETVLPSR